MSCGIITEAFPAEIWEHRSGIQEQDFRIDPALEGLYRILLINDPENSLYNVATAQVYEGHDMATSGGAIQRSILLHTPAANVPALQSTNVSERWFVIRKLSRIAIKLSAVPGMYVRVERYATIPPNYPNAVRF